MKTENYAGIFICKEVEGIHYQMISYWSRKPTLSEDIITSFNEKLSKFEEIDLTYLKPVKQTCEAQELVEVVDVVTEVYV